MTIRMSWNIDIPRSLNSRDSFPRRKVENRAPKSCRSGAILSLSITSFELHAKVAKEIDLEMCSHGQFSEIQMFHDLDLGWDQGHINIHSMCRTNSMPNHMTIASCITEIWPFECREIWTFGKSLNSRDSFPRTKFKNWAQTSVSPILSPSTISFELHAETVREIDLEKWNFATSEAPFTLDRVEVTLVRMWSRSTDTKLGRNLKNFLWTYGRTHLSSNLLGHRLEMTQNLKLNENSKISFWN